MRARRSVRRSRASAAAARSSSVSNSSAGTESFFPSLSRATKVRRALVVSCRSPRHRVLAVYGDPDLHRGGEGGDDPRPQRDGHAHLDRCVKMQVVHRGGDDGLPRVPLRTDRRADVDPPHDASAERGPERVRIAREENLRHLGERVFRALRRNGAHAAGIASGGLSKVVGRSKNGPPREHIHRAC